MRKYFFFAEIFKHVCIDVGWALRKYFILLKSITYATRIYLRKQYNSVELKEKKNIATCAPQLQNYVLVIISNTNVI